MTIKGPAAENTSDSPKLLPGSNKWWLILSLVAVALISVYVRILTAAPIEDGGDAIHTWQLVHMLLTGESATVFAYGSPLRLLRWAINVPAMAVQLIFGYSVTTYYISTVVYATIASCLVLLLGARAGRPVAGFAASLLYIFSIEMQRAGSQLLPDTYGVCYVLGALLLVDLYRSRRQSYLIVISAALLFCAYGSNVAYLGMTVPVAAFLFCNRDMKAIAILAGVLLALFCIETGVLAYWTGDFRPFGVVQLVWETSMEAWLIKYKGLYGWWDRWERLSVFWQYQVAAGLAAAIYYIARSVGVRDYQSTVLLLSIALVWFCLFVTFAIVDVDPVKFLFNPRARYLQLTLPLAALTASFLIWDIVSLLVAIALPAPPRSHGQCPRALAARLALSAAIFSILMTAVLLRPLLDGRTNLSIARSNIFLMEQLRRDTRAYYEGGYILAFLRLKTAIVINRIFLGNPIPIAQADGYGSPKIFYYDGKALYLSIIKRGSRTESGPVLDPKLLELIQNDPCVSTQLTTRLGANGIYFFSNERDFPRGVALFGNPLKALTRHRGATCFFGIPGPPPLEPAPSPDAAAGSQ